MKNIITWGLRISIILFAILHFTTSVYKNSVLTIILAICGFAILLFASLHLKFKKLKLSIMLFFSSVAILILSGHSIQNGFFNGLLQMRNIIGLLIIIPMISWVLNEDYYIEAIIWKTQKLLNTSRKMYLGIISFTQIISFFLLFGAIPMMYQFVNMLLKNEKGEVWEKYKGTAILRGFALSVMWVISIPSFIFVVEIMNASLWISIVQGLGVSICGILIALIFSYFEEKRSGVDLTASLQAEFGVLINKVDSMKNNKKLITEFIILFVSLFGVIFLVNRIFHIQLMLLIPIVIVLWTLIYYLVKRRLWKFFDNAVEYGDKQILNQSYQLSVMLGAGMLIYALNQTEFGMLVVNGINHLQNSVSFINVLHLLPFMVLVLGFLGLGPLTVVVLVAGILQNLNLPYAPELIVLTVTSGSAISILLSPLLMPNIVLSSVNGLSSLKNGIKFNLTFAVFIYIMVQLYVQIMVKLGF